VCLVWHGDLCNASREIKKEVGERIMRFSSIGWLIGYFIVFAPMHLMYEYSPIFSLLFSILGVAVAIIMEALN